MPLWSAAADGCRVLPTDFFLLSGVYAVAFLFLSFSPCHSVVLFFVLHVFL